MSDAPVPTEPAPHDERVGVGEWLAVAALTILGGALRLYGSGHAPGFYFDEALYALDGLRVLEQPGWPVAFEAEAHAREGFFMYCLAIAFRLFGATAEVARGTSAFVGMLTIPAVWWMCRTFWGRGAGLAGLAVIAFMQWSVHFGSLCFRTNTTPLLGALSAALMVRFARRPTPASAAAAGLALGLGAHTYMAWRLVPFVLAVALAGWWLAARRGRGPALPPWRMIAVAAGFAALATAPLGAYALRHPDMFFGRTERLASQTGEDGRAAATLRQARDVALMFSIRGDHEVRHNLQGGPDFVQLWWLGLPGAEEDARWQDARANGTAPDVHGTGLPVFDPVSALLFHVGLAVCALRAARGRPIELGLLAWLAVGLLASVLSFGAPNLLRTTLVIPAVVAILVVGVLAAGRFLLERARVPLVATCLLAVANLAVTDVRRHLHWLDHPRTESGFSPDVAALGRMVGGGHLGGDAPVLVPDALAGSPVTRFLLHQRVVVPCSAAAGRSVPDRFVLVVTRPPWPACDLPKGWHEGARPSESRTLSTQGFAWGEVTVVERTSRGF